MGASSNSSDAYWEAFFKVAGKRHWAVTFGSLLFSLPGGVLLAMAGHFLVSGGPWALFLGLSLATWAAGFTVGQRWVQASVQKRYPWPELSA